MSPTTSLPPNATPLDIPRDLPRTLATLRHGSRDPTTKVSATDCWHATITPDGPGALHLRWRANPAPSASAAGLTVTGHGPGGAWLEAHADDLIGEHDQPVDLIDAPRVVRQAMRLRAGGRLTATRNPYHQLIPIILAQRITAREAVRQWHRLVLAYGMPWPYGGDAPAGLHLPPSPEALAAVTSWEFHRLGIEQSRARALVSITRVFSRLFEWAAASSSDPFTDKLELLHGVGPWTSSSVARVCTGDADAVVVGDFHFPHAVSFHLTGRPRASDDDMLELLAPYAGHRGRVQMALVALGSAPAFGPRRRIIDTRRM